MGRLLPIELKEFDAETLNGTYQNFGSPLDNPAIKINVFNEGDTDVYISRDGATNFMRIPAGGAIVLDESTLYFRGVDQEYYLPRGTQLTITQVTGASTITPSAIVAHIVTRVLQ